MHLFTSLTLTTPASNILLIPSESPAHSSSSSTASTRHKLNHLFPTRLGRRMTESRFLARQKQRCYSPVMTASRSSLPSLPTSRDSLGISAPGFFSCWGMDALDQANKRSAKELLPRENHAEAAPARCGRAPRCLGRKLGRGQADEGREAET